VTNRQNRAAEERFRICEEISGKPRFMTEGKACHRETLRPAQATQHDHQVFGARRAENWRTLQRKNRAAFAARF